MNLETRYGRLVGQEVVMDNNLSALNSEFQDPKRILAQTEVGIFRSCFVSTVFLVINHGWGEKNLWFETMIFGAGYMRENEYQERYETYEEAMAGHWKAVRIASRWRILHEISSWFRSLFKKEGK